MMPFRRILLLIAIIASANAAGADAPWRVVIIRNWDALYRVNTIREEGLRETLLGNAPREIEIYPEQIDNLRFQKGFDEETAALLQRQYRDIKVDVVIATGVEPLGFAAAYRDRVWPGAAIVFLGITDGWLEGWSRPPRTAGVTTVLDVAGTLELGLALRPSARRVYFIAGTSEFDQRYLEQAKAVARKFEDRLEARYIVGESRAQIVERATRVEPDSLLFYLTVLRDGEGRFGGPFNTILWSLHERSPAPLLSAVHTQWDRGPVGGSSSRSDEHGRAAGRLVRRILDGADPDLIPISASPPPSCVVDWRGLERWSISEGTVPSRCSIANKPPQIWRDHFWEFLALLTIIVVQFGLLWLVVVHSRARRIAERHLHERGIELARVARLASMGQLAASIAHEINQPIGAILSNAEAAKIMLERGTLDDATLREILSDICSEDLRASEVVRGLRRMFAQRKLDLTPTDLNALVAEALRHLRSESMRRATALSTVFSPDLPPVLADAVELQQVVLNLVMNAMEAVAAEPESMRAIRIETRAAAGGVKLVVSDSGPGLSPADAQRVFSSHFTTKKDGMGFGLSLVKTIVELHQGRIRYEANGPRGAVFLVWLPATPPA